ncbi:hypothetical protein MHYP_G00223800 [Metynnis hypsauchen]
MQLIANPVAPPLPAKFVRLMLTASGPSGRGLEGRASLRAFGEARGKEVFDGTASVTTFSNFPWAFMTNQPSQSPGSTSPVQSRE